MRNYRGTRTSRLDPMSRSSAHRTSRSAHNEQISPKCRRQEAVQRTASAKTGGLKLTNFALDWKPHEPTSSAGPTSSLAPDSSWESSVRIGLPLERKRLCWASSMSPANGQLGTYYAPAVGTSPVSPALDGRHRMVGARGAHGWDTIDTGPFRSIVSPNDMYIEHPTTAAGMGSTRDSPQSRS